jgi:hypothetical protein
MQKSLIMLMALWTLCWAGSIHAAEDHPFTLENGNVIEGYIADMNEETLVIRRKTGDFSERLELVYLSQDTLNWIKEQPEYASKGYDVLVDPYLELPEEEIKPPIINVKEPERPLKPVTREDASFMASLGSPIGLLLVVVLYLGNLYAAFHIALFMSRPVPLVCGVSAIFPVFGPILFACMPPLAVASSEETYIQPEATSDGAPMPPPPPPAPGAADKPALGVGIAKKAGGAEAGLEGRVFSSSDTEFTKTFLETTFSEFFRAVPSPKIKGLLLVVKTVKKEVVATRITRISGKDFYLRSQSAQEVSVSFGEIVSIEVRRK